MPLTTGMLSVSGGSKVEMSMKSDAIAVTVPVNEYTGITNDLKEGARVNIYANLDSTVALIQQNKRVLEVFKSNDGVITGVAVEGKHPGINGINLRSYKWQYLSWFGRFHRLSGFRRCSPDIFPLF